MNIQITRKGITHSLALAFSMALIFTLTFFLTGEPSNANTVQEKRLPDAQIAKPEVRNIPIVHTVPGYLEAQDRVELHPQVSGYLQKATLVEGARVRKGDLLFVIDQRPYQAALAKAEAHLQQARANATFAESDSLRAKALYQQQAISKEDAERRQAAAMAAQANVVAAQAAVTEALLDLQFTEIRAPISGRIGQAEITEGNLVTPANRLAVIVATDPLYVRFSIDERTYAHYADQPIPPWGFDFDVPGTTSAKGAITFVDNEMDSSTGTLSLRATIPNPEERLKPGQYGIVSLTLRHQENALLISEKAIGVQQGQRNVLTLSDQNVLKMQPVTLGRRVGDLRVIEQGLTREDRIVTTGLMRLRPGMTVNPLSVYDDVASAH